MLWPAAALPCASQTKLRSQECASGAPGWLSLGTGLLPLLSLYVVVDTAAAAAAAAVGSHQ